MTDPRLLAIEDFTYHLPDSRIAAYPKENRHESNLLIYRSGQITHHTFRNIAAHLPPHSFMVLNNTRVVEARIIFNKPTGARIEIFCIEPHQQYADVATALSQQRSVLWKCLVGRSSSWTHQTTLEKKLSNEHSLFARIISKHDDHFIVQLSWLPENLTFADILHLAGDTPLPPYIKRKAEQTDAERYQTVYARQPGSVAAPTAGLHFTKEVFEELAANAIAHDYVTLHVSAGTFKPVKAGMMSDHDMHAEFIDVSFSFIKKLQSAIGNNQRIIAVGTTSLRTLESLYWIGRKIYLNTSISIGDLQVSQWEPYDKPDDVSVAHAIEAILKYMTNLNIASLITKTSVLIAPSYRFKIVDMLVTNFHQPRSTLLLLVAAFIGDDWHSVYSYALENDFRFLSYGDSCLLFRK